MAKRITPLMVLLILGIGLCGVVIADWYWSSPSITGPTIYVGGSIAAKVVDPRTVWNGGQEPYADLVPITELLDGAVLTLDPNMYFAFIKVGSTNAADLYLKIDVTRPAGMYVSANVRYLAIQEDYTWTSADMLLATDVAIDGSQSVSLELNEDPLYALYDSPTCVIFVVVEFSIGPGSLPWGNHPMSVVFSLGDSL